MDTRTVALLEALDSIGASILLRLLAGPATEAQLISAIPELTQWTANRRLSRLAKIGVVERPPSKLHAPGGEWSLAHPDATESLLSALLALATAIDTRDREERGRVGVAIKRGRAKRRNLRVVGGQGGGPR